MKDYARTRDLERLQRDIGKDAQVFSPIISKPTPAYWVTVLILSAILVWGIYAYLRQIQYGLGVTGLNRPMYWGFYIINFVFWIGIAHAGTLISSVLRVTSTEWRRPFTRAAEAVTVFSLPFAAINPIIDLGRPDRLLNVFRTPHFTSPLLWDVICISIYLTFSIIYFYIALLPDLAMCRDYLISVSPFRRWLYKSLSLGFRYDEKRWKKIEWWMNGLAIFLFMVVVSVHTNVSFVFLMTLQPGWHTTILAPYFVLGAIYSGCAAVILIMALLRWVYRLHDYVTDAHFQKMAKFMIALALFWLYFTGIEFLAIYYGHEIAPMTIFHAKVFGAYKDIFWLMFLLTFLLPLTLLVIPRTRNIFGLVIASISIIVGMWLERYTVIVPSEAYPRMANFVGLYFPTWVEWSITAALLAGFCLFYVLFARFFPILTVWEVREGREHGVQHFISEMESFYPGEKFHR